jgi:DNA-binding LacI/PurR family transcriptional regulator
VTLKTVADRVGVSAMTVSNAFSRPDQLSAALREKILAAAAELGYVGPDPGRAHAGPRRDRHGRHPAHRVAAVRLQRRVLDHVPGRHHPGTGPYRPGPDAAAQRPGRATSSRPGTSPWTARWPTPAGPASTASSGCAGAGCRWCSSTSSPEPGYTSINVDDRAAAAGAVRHVVDLGHRRIALLTVGLGIDAAEAGSSDFLVARQRLSGWLDVLGPAGIEPAVLRSEVSTQEDGLAAVRDVLTGPDRPTAVLCFSDALAGGVVRAAEDAGLRVPQDLSVVGYDDTPLARRMRPALTTVHQDAAEKGRLAAAELAAAVARHRAGLRPRGAPRGAAHRVDGAGEHRTGPGHRPA